MPPKKRPANSKTVASKDEDTKDAHQSEIGDSKKNGTDEEVVGNTPKKQKKGAEPKKEKTKASAKSVDEKKPKSKKATEEKIKAETNTETIKEKKTKPKAGPKKTTKEPKEEKESEVEPRKRKLGKTKDKPDAEGSDEPPKKKTVKKDVKEKPTEKAPKKKKETAVKENKPEGINNTETDWEQIDFKCNKKNGDGQKGNFKITSWNVDGMRAWLKKDGLNILKYDSPDILCLQETKCNEDSIPDEIAEFEGYKKYWCSSSKNGYAGVGLLTKKEPIEVSYGIGDEDQDEDGRCITAEYEKFYLVTVYVPNAGRKLVTLDKRLNWNEAFKGFIKELDEKKPVIICGDMNVAHSEIDLTNPKTNTKNAGFTPQEREGMTDFLEVGFVDTFRALYPDQKDSYTFWSYMSSARKKNIGWRLDYFLVSERIKNKVCDNVIHDKVFGSDHCPLTLFINI
ncbi:exodeoxyribonuclease-like isoform X2 [Harmonia axyridis]|nr:exodeoxyribonuclease-like isoform X2 [Harmonia axyridis]